MSEPVTLSDANAEDVSFETPVVISEADWPCDRLFEAGDVWERRGVDTWLLSRALGVIVSYGGGEEVDGLPLLRLRNLTRGRFPRVAKRGFDLCVATLALILLSPLLAVIAVAVKVNSSGPVLHRQQRVGQDGAPFTFLKFRSMIDAAPSDVHESVSRRWADADPPGLDERGDRIYKLPNDPRVTSIGRFLRRTSLDELPQLVNVLRGEMSLVGPRPCTPFELALYKPWHHRRLDALPGCTGLWQVTARSYVGLDDMVLLDLHYLANWSLWQDVRLLFKTVPVMALGRGGH